MVRIFIVEVVIVNKLLLRIIHMADAVRIAPKGPLPSATSKFRVAAGHVTVEIIMISEMWLLYILARVFY